MEITRRAVSVEVRYEVYGYFCESELKAENLSYQKRRNWDMREFDEVIVHRLIHKVVDGEKIQRVMIVYNFVGELGESVYK